MQGLVPRRGRWFESIQAHRFRLVRDRALLYAFRDTPGRLGEIAKYGLMTWT